MPVYTPFVDFTVGDYKVKVTPPNQRLQSFTYVRETNDAVNNFELQFTDESALEVERQLSLGHQEISFKYGWSNQVGEISKEYKGMILDYGLTFTEGMLAEFSVEGVSSSILSHTDKRTFTYVKENGRPMRIHEILKNISEYEGWKFSESNIEKTLPVVEPSENQSLDNISIDEAEKTFSQDGISSTRFIKSVLIPNAVSKKSGRGGYCLWFDDIGDKPVVNFKPPSYDREPTNKYEYRMNTRNSNIISFSPDFNAILQMQEGAGQIVTKCNDAISNDMISLKRTNLDEINYKFSESKKVSDKKFKVYQNTSSGSEISVNKQQNVIKTKASNHMYNATLELRGSPNLKVWDTVTILVVTREGYLHHTSGLYMIKRIEDTIDSSGDFISSLELIRDSSRAGEVNVEGEKSDRDLYRRERE